MAKAEIQNALKVIKELVEQESSQDEAFTTNRFFKDAKTKGKIQRVVASAKRDSTKLSRKPFKVKA